MDLVIQTVDSASDQVEAYFRHAIESGGLKPGTKLPSNQALAARFGVSATVVQTALSRLSRDGFLERKRRKGTFIRKFQEKANIALLFGDSLADETAHYYRALLKRFNEACGERKWGCRHWSALNSEMFSSDAVERRKDEMLRDHRSHPFTGVIEYSPGSQSLIPEEFHGKIASVSYGDNPAEVEISGGNYSFGVEAVRCLTAQGCRRIFYFCTVWHNRSFTESIDGLLDAARELGLSAPKVHIEPYSTQSYEMETAMHRRMREIIAGWRETEFPDGLVVNDDIAMRAMAPAILEAGIKVPGDLKVFCEGNEDVRFHYGFPVIRYEVSPKAVAEFLLSALERRMNGESLAKIGKPQNRKIHYEKT